MQPPPGGCPMQAMMRRLRARVSVPDRAIVYDLPEGYQPPANDTTSVNGTAASYPQPPPPLDSGMHEVSITGIEVPEEYKDVPDDDEHNHDHDFDDPDTVSTTPTPTTTVPELLR